MSLAEAIARFRALDEVQVGDYVTAPVDTHGWKGGYVVAVKGNRIAFQWPDDDDTKTSWIDVSKANVNPGGPTR